jgi:hypothetical protein
MWPRSAVIVKLRRPKRDRRCKISELRAKLRGRARHPSPKPATRTAGSASGLRRGSECGSFVVHPSPIRAHPQRNGSKARHRPPTTGLFFWFSGRRSRPRARASAQVLIAGVVSVSALPLLLAHLRRFRRPALESTTGKPGARRRSRIAHSARTFPSRFALARFGRQKAGCLGRLWLGQPIDQDPADRGTHGRDHDFRAYAARSRGGRGCACCHAIHATAPIDAAPRIQGRELGRDAGT